MINDPATYGFSPAGDHRWTRSGDVLTRYVYASRWHWQIRGRGGWRIESRPGEPLPEFLARAAWYQETRR